jgi:hypothetical protein
VCFPPHLWTETDPVSETCSLTFRIPDGGQISNSSNSEYVVNYVGTTVVALLCEMFYEYIESC